MSDGVSSSPAGGSSANAVAAAGVGLGGVGGAGGSGAGNSIANTPTKSQSPSSVNAGFDVSDMVNNGFSQIQNMLDSFVSPSAKNSPLGDALSKVKETMDQVSDAFQKAISATNEAQKNGFFAQFQSLTFELEMRIEKVQQIDEEFLKRLLEALQALGLLGAIDEDFMKAFKDLLETWSQAAQNGGQKYQVEVSMQMSATSIHISNEMMAIHQMDFSLDMSMEFEGSLEDLFSSINPLMNMFSLPNTGAASNAASQLGSQLAGSGLPMTGQGGQNALRSM